MTYPYNPYQNPYNPYNPYQPNYQPMQQQMQYQPPVQPQQQNQATQQPQQAPIQNGGLVEVRSYDEVERWPVAPGNVVTFIKYDRTEMYTKTASYNQFEAPVIATFLITRKEGAEVPQNAESVIPYAMKEDVSALAGVVKEVNDNVNNITNTITTMKDEVEKISSDMYGLQGRKKSSKKETQEE